MERMGKDAALDAIREPAELGGRPFAPGVAEKLVDDLRQVRVPGQEATVAGPDVEPVQLQVVCFQLWERLRGAEDGGRQTADGGQSAEGRFITEADLAEAGNVNQALEQFYTDTLAAVLADERVVAAGVSERALRTWFDKELLTETGIRNTVFRNESSGRTGIHAQRRRGCAGAALPAAHRAARRRRLGGAGARPLRGADPGKQRRLVSRTPEHLAAPGRPVAEPGPARRTAAERRGAGRGGTLGRRAAGDGWSLTSGSSWLHARRRGRTAERERRQSRRIRLLAAVAFGVAVFAIIAAVFAVTQECRS